MNAVNALGMAVFDLFTMDKQIPTACSADVRASNEIKVLDLQIASLKGQIRGVSEAEQEVLKNLNDLYKDGGL